MIAGTQLVEALWRVLKSHQIPKELRASEREIEAYLLAYLARRWELGDPLVNLGLAVSEYIARFDDDPWSNEPYLYADHNDDDAETIVRSDVEPLF